MNKIELILNKSYVVVDSRNNQIIHFCDNIEEAKEIADLDIYFVIYRITNNIICYPRQYLLTRLNKTIVLMLELRTGTNI